MKTNAINLMLVAALAGWDGTSVRAAEAPPSSSPGKVLILKNEFTMEGDIERVENRYRVRGKGGETWVPADRVRAVVPTLSDAYAYLRKRINLDDADERLWLARWCFTNNLHDRGMSELQTAARLRPEHAETRRLLLYWQQAVSKPVKPTESASAKPSTETEELPPVEVTTDSLGLFVTRVQPILMNACARCHASGRGGDFHLTQVYDDGIGNRRSMEKNLAAVIKQVDLNRPQASRFLVKAISDHAHAGQAPIRDRQAPPYRALEQWVKLTVANNPHLNDHGPRSSSAPSGSKDKQTKGEEESEWGADARTVTNTPDATTPLPLPQTAPNPSKGTTPTLPAAMPLLVDPYDPEFFNRKMHPETNESSPAKASPRPGKQDTKE